VSLVVEQYGAVRRLRMASLGSRAVGMDVSAYVLGDIMIDCGFHRARRELVEAMSSLGVRGAIVTHWHEDHAGNVAFLAAHGVPLMLRTDTGMILRQRPHIQLYRRVVWGHPPPLNAAVRLLEADAFECIHTPGHSEDHQVVWHAATGTLFSGDLWLGVRARVLHATEDPYLILESLRRAAELDAERMFDAHRGFVDRPTEALLAKAAWLGETMETIAARLRAGWGHGEIVKRVLGGEERAALVSGGDYSRRNLVKAVARATGHG
jgi:glyoxylase-like metal-dependent hydrolase (beta-lactamase superfamily II)